MVEECCKFVNQTPDIETKLKLIDTLRTVTEGKVGVGWCGWWSAHPLTVKSLPPPPCIVVLDIR